VQPACRRKREGRRKTKHGALLRQAVNPKLIALVRPHNGQLQALRQLARAARMVDMRMGEPNGLQIQPQSRYFGKDSIQIATRVNHGSLLGLAAPQQGTVLLEGGDRYRGVVQRHAGDYTCLLDAASRARMPCSHAFHPIFLEDVMLLSALRRSLVFSGLLAVGVLATSAHAQDKPRFKVVTTFTVIADMARNVAGDAAQVESITKPGAEVHEYQPTPGDLVRAQGAQLILWNGMNLELWFEKFFQQLKNVPSVTVTAGIEPMGIGEGPYQGKANPHAWMSPTAAAQYVDNIRDALVKYDPKNAATYQANATAYKAKIAAAIDPIRQRLAQLPEQQRWLVSSEGAFSYLARDFGLKELYLWPINAEQQGTPQQIRKVIDAVKQHGIKAVFSESTISPAPAQQVARETGAQYGGVLYVDSLSEAGGPVPTYLDMLRVTAETIAKGLGS